MTKRRGSFGSAVVTLALWIGTVPAATVPVTTCGQVVAGTGALAADLDCSATTGAAVTLGPGARLQLAGFTLTGNETGVQCDVGACRIDGPGTIRRPTYVAGNFRGVVGLLRLRIANVVLENWPIALYVLGPIQAKGCTIRDGGWGVLGERTTIVDSTFSNNVIGVHGSEGTPSGPGFGIKYIFWGVRIRHSTFTANGIDVASYKRPVVRDTTCTTSDLLTLAGEPFGGGDEWGICN